MDADLAEVTTAWPSLSADVKRSILHVVRASVSREQSKG